ncbi:MAG: hypothetical protein WKF43_02430 [Acidimicrobiales bacterium]
MADFWAPVFELLDRAVNDGFLTEQVRSSIIYDTTVAGVLDQFATWRRPGLGKWIDLEPPTGSETNTEVL